MTIKEAADQLQALIDDKMEAFTILGKEAKILANNLSKVRVKMGEILINLEPVDSIIRTQHPEKVVIFDSLINEAKKHND